MTAGVGSTPPRGKRRQLALAGEIGGAPLFFALASGANRIGSGDTNHFVLPVDGVSRQHAMVIVDDDGAQVLDHGSKNGTFVNGERIRHARTQAGDEIWLGPVELRLETVAVDDVELAIELEAATAPATLEIPSPETTVEVRHPGGPRAEARAVASSLVFPPGHVRGVAATVEQLYTEMEHLSASDLPVLICGETGVGKELVARSLHLSSRRREATFVAINCAAVPAELLEAELFGIGRGVATGVTERKGRFREADGGTLFLDEVGEMPAELQAKLLRVLQEREISPLGGAPVAIDVRLLSATNAEIYSDMDAGRFRHDLFYRLAGSVLRVPSLRQRRADIPVFAEEFLRAFAGAADKPIRGITVAAGRALTRYAWPGNVRELEHEIQRLAYACPAGQAISLRLLAAHIRDRAGSAGDPQAVPSPEPAGGAQTAAAALPTLELAALERLALEEALRRSGGNRAETARLLGISRYALLRRLKRYRL